MEASGREDGTENAAYAAPISQPGSLVKRLPLANLAGASPWRSRDEPKLAQEWCCAGVPPVRQRHGLPVDATHAGALLHQHFAGLGRAGEGRSRPIPFAGL